MDSSNKSASNQYRLLSFQEIVSTEESFIQNVDLLLNEYKQELIVNYYLTKRKLKTRTQK